MGSSHSAAPQGVTEAENGGRLPKLSVSTQPRGSTARAGGTNGHARAIEGQTAAPVAAGSMAVVTDVIAGATALGPGELEQAVRDTYKRIILRLRASGASHPVRFWNFIPRIHERLGGRSRYIVFNAGRFAALAGANADTPDGSGNGRSFPTASGVGYDGEDLVVHCLGATRPGEPIENPRQIPAYRYSARFGLHPPCFTRATSLAIESGRPPALLVAGTASVVGEDSRHPGDLNRQLEETFANLDALLGAWRARIPEHLLNGGPPDLASLRAYYVREGDREVILAAILARYPRIGVVETVRADICRPELLVEIECTIGTSALAASGASRHGLGA